MKRKIWEFPRWPVSKSENKTFLPWPNYFLKCAKNEMSYAVEMSQAIAMI